MDKLEDLAQRFVEYELKRNGSREDRLEVIGSSLEEAWVDVFHVFLGNAPGATELFELIVDLSTSEAALSFAELVIPGWIQSGGTKVVDWLAGSTSPAVQGILGVVIVPGKYVASSNESLRGRVFDYGGPERGKPR